MAVPLTKYEPIILTTVYLTGVTYRFATKDFYDGLDNYFKGSLVEDPELISQLSDLYYGVETSSSLTLKFANRDNGLDDTWDTVVITNAKELRGRWIKVERYDPTDGTTFEFRGKIVSYKLGSVVEITIEMRDDDILETLLPSDTITTDGFTVTALDLGEPINICFGRCRNVPLPNIQNNTGANQYDYLIGYGTIESLWVDHPSDIGIKRDGVLVDTSEYTFDDGSGAPTDHGYAGYATIRFAKEQMDFTGNYHKLTADVKGLELGGATAERNFATVIKNILDDTTWGLSDSIDAASFTAAATALDTIGNMYCDGAVTKQRKARDIINDLLFPARARIWRATDGEWEIDIDDGGASVLNLGENDGYYDNCEVLEASSVVSTEALKTAIVHYSLDPSNEEIPFKELTVSAHSGFGIDRTYDLPFVMEDNTAIRVLSYLKNRSIYSDKTVIIRGGMECRDLSIGKIITLTSPIRVISAKEYMIENITKSLSSFQLECREYSASIYGNEAIGAPTGPTGRDYVVKGPKTWVGSISLGDGVELPGQVTLVVAPGQGDTWIAAGKTDFTNAQNGFILGIDDSDADKAKFYLGSATDYFNWNGTNIVISVGAANAITILAGGDILLTPSDANPALIKWTNAHNMGASSVLTARGLCIWPETANTQAFQIGYDTINDVIQRYDSIFAFSEVRTYLNTYYDATHYSYLDLRAGAALGTALLVARCGGGEYRIYLNALTGQTDFTGYITTAGGIHVGGLSDPGADNLVVDGYVKLGITDVDGTVEGQLWYDASEDKLKFKTAAGVETITSV